MIADGGDLRSAIALEAKLFAFLQTMSGDRTGGRRVSVSRGERNCRRRKSSRRRSRAFVSWPALATNTPLNNQKFCGSPGMTTVCWSKARRGELRRGGSFGPSVGWLVGCLGHEDICTQRSSRDVATAAYLFRSKSKTI